MALGGHGAVARAARLAVVAFAWALRPARGLTTVTISDCDAGDGEYFDISRLECVSCDSGLRPHESGRACVCAGDRVAVSVEDAFEAEDSSDSHCRSCPSGTVPVRPDIIGLPEPALGGTCLRCGVATLDSSVAVANDTATVTVAGCDNATTPDPTLGECSADGSPEARCPSTSSDLSPACACPLGFVVTEVSGHGALLSEKRCERCAAHLYPDSSSGYAARCLPCPDDRMVYSVSSDRCECPSGWSREDHSEALWGRSASCLLSDAKDDVQNEVSDVSLASRVTYAAVEPGTSASGATVTETIDSATVEQLFLVSAADCTVAAVTQRAPAPGYRSACQALGNLCVLQDYDEDSPACSYLRHLQSRISDSVRSEPEWKPQLPWLYHGDASATLRDATLSLTVAVEEGAGADTNRLRLVLNSYSLNGTWLGFTDVTTHLQLCGGPTAELSAFLRFGTSFSRSCALRVQDDLANLGLALAGALEDGDLADDGDAVRPAGFDAELRGAFHELYVADRDDELFPVPIRVTNYPGRVNVNSAAQAYGTIPSARDFATVDDVLTRRFFLVDALSGRKVGSKSTDAPSVVRFAKTMDLDFRVQEADPSRLFPPVLTITYAEALTTGAADATVQARFTARYSMDLEQYWSTIVVLIVLASVMVFVVFAITMFAWIRRNQRVVLDGSMLGAAAVLLLRAYADVFFIFVLALCAHWYVFFKGQAQAFLLLPAEEEAGPLVVMLALALAAKAVHIVAIVLRQARADVFLVDWETAHGTLVGQDGQPGAPAPVSAWRLIFCANELNELQCARLTRPALTLVLVLLFMVGADFERFARAVPGDGAAAAASPHSQPHVLLRFAVSSFVWAVVLVGEGVVIKLLWLPYVEDKVGQLVDLLSVANVSLLILPETYAGYYLHGRSVHAHADASMLELNEQLRAEEEGIPPHRGLTPASELQTFEVFITPGLRELYDSKFLHAALATTSTRGAWRARAPNNPSKTPLQGLAIERARRPGDGFRANPKESVERYASMAELLRGWIDGSLAEHEYAVRERTYNERLLGMAPDMSFARDSLFLYDKEGRWTRSLLYGHEWDLCLFEVLVYSVADLSLRSSYLAAAITYLTWLVVAALRSWLGQANLARKTLIDDRFLI